MFAFSLRYLKSEADAEEIVQDVYVKIWENRNKLKHETSFKSYLFTIAYNDICKVFRRRKYHEQYVNEMLNGLGATSGDTNYTGLLSQIEHLVSQLPEKRREIFNLRHNEGKSSKEIAKELNISPGTVDNNISQALNYIRQNIDKNNLALLLFISLFLS